MDVDIGSSHAPKPAPSFVAGHDDFAMGEVPEIRSEEHPMDVDSTFTEEREEPEHEMEQEDEEQKEEEDKQEDEQDEEEQDDQNDEDYSRDGTFQSILHKSWLTYHYRRFIGIRD